MALDKDLLRAAVEAQKVERPAFTEADLEAEKARLRTEIAEQQQLSDDSTGTTDGLISFNEMALQNKIGRLAELEAGGLAAMLTREQEEERVADAFNASMMAKYDGKKPEFAEEET